MKIEILSKDGCSYCEKSANFLDNLNLKYIKTNVDKKTLQSRVPGASVYPQIVINDIPIGGYFELEEYFEKDPLLAENPNRFTIFPCKLA